MSSTRRTLERTAWLSHTRIEGVIDVPVGTYLRVVAGNIVEWVPFGPGSKGRSTKPPKRGKAKSRHPRPKQAQLQPLQHGYLHGITDRFAAGNNDPDAVDWWAQAERWPTGVEILADRPRNEHGW